MDENEAHGAGAVRSTLEAVHAEVLAIVGRDSRLLQRHGIGSARVDIVLRADQEALAARLRARFGDTVGIRLGRHDFPLSRVPVAPPAAPVSTIEPRGLQLAVELDRETWRPGEVIRGVLRLTNIGTGDPVRFSTGSTATGVLLDLDGVPVADCSLPGRGAGRRVDLALGEETNLRVVSGSDTFDPSRGAALVPGEYVLVVVVRATLDERRGLVVAPPVPIRIE